MRKFDRQAWLIRQLRRLTFRYPPAAAALNDVKTEYYVLSKKGKQMRRVKFSCFRCGEAEFKRTEVELDHIVPVIEPGKGFVDMNTFCDRLFCERSNYQVLCKPCHQLKTQSENVLRTPSKKYARKRKKA